MAFHLAKVEPYYRDTILLMAQVSERTGEELIIGYDDDFREFKFKVGSGVWSPPITGVITRD